MSSSLPEIPQTDDLGKLCVKSWQSSLLFVRRSSSPLKGTWRTKKSCQCTQVPSVESTEWQRPAHTAPTTLLQSHCPSPPLSPTICSIFSLHGFPASTHDVLSILPHFVWWENHHHPWRYCYVKHPPEVSHPLLGAFRSLALISRGTFVTLCQTIWQV